MTETRTHLITMDTPHLFASDREFIERFQELLPGDLYGEPGPLEFFEQHADNFLNNKVTIRISVQETE